MARSSTAIRSSSPRSTWCSTSGWSAGCAISAASNTRPRRRCCATWACPTISRLTSGSRAAHPSPRKTRMIAPARTAIFEMLIVDDNVRKAAVVIGRVNKEPKKDDGKKGETKKLTAEEYREEMGRIARLSGHLTLAEEGICAAAAGITSLEELRRV